MLTWVTFQFLSIVRLPLLQVHAFALPVRFPPLQVIFLIHTFQIISWHFLFKLSGSKLRLPGAGGSFSRLPLLGQKPRWWKRQLLSMKSVSFCASAVCLVFKTFFTELGMKILSFVQHTEVVQINSLERISEHFDSEKLCSGFISTVYGVSTSLRFVYWPPTFLLGTNGSEHWFASSSGRVVSQTKRGAACMRRLRHHRPLPHMWGLLTNSPSCLAYHWIGLELQFWQPPTTNKSIVTRFASFQWNNLQSIARRPQSQ